MNLEEKIGKYIDRYNDKLLETESKKEEHEQSLETLKKKFIVIIKRDIEPVMKEFKEFLKKKNQSCNINSSLSSKEELPEIGFKIFPSNLENKYDSHNNHYPEIIFGLKESGKIAVKTLEYMPKGGGSSSPADEFELKDILPEFVEDKIINLIKNCYDKNWESYHFD